MNFRDPSPRLRRWLTFAFAMFALSLFGALAGEMREDNTQHWDQAALQLAQQWRATHPLVEAIMRELSALGSTPVMTLFTVLAAVYLCTVGRLARAVAVSVAMITGALAVTALKAGFGRARPDPAFAALVQEGLSFPSGHASMSAVFYLTVGVLVAQRHDGLRLRVFVVGIAAFMAVLVGITRVMLGVHWASDVLAGWAFGAGWAALWFCIAAQLRDVRRQRTSGLG
ncbi:phosphatase PAP2 family protein [Roseateles sp. DC23W]|uniref:Phosphatase PAP2 family protein n=1 Tax=Pelomonas dachongensis TaxID=3299029 RepID=A0ABW7EMM1_9BURK